MNQATREYLDAIRRAKGVAEKGVADADGARSAYYPCFAGALQAILAAEIAKRHNEGVDYEAVHDGKTEKAA